MKHIYAAATYYRRTYFGDYRYKYRGWVVSGRSRIGNNVQGGRYEAGGDKIDKKEKSERLKRERGIQKSNRKKNRKKDSEWRGAHKKKRCRKYGDKEGEYLHKHVTGEGRKRWGYIERGREREGCH